jgi:membrane protease YdiL (CAAX protease family)
MNKTLKVIIITLLSFAVYYVLDDLFFNKIRDSIYGTVRQIGVSHILAYVISGIPLYTGVYLLHKFTGFFDSLGFNRPLIKGMFFPLLCTLPMFIGFAFVFKFNPKITWNEILIGVVAAAFFEELFFRAFLFGQLYRYTRLGFIPSVILGALLFASVHLYQSQDFSTLTGIFAITFLGAILFAWVYAEWNFNLWIPVFFHLFMNLAWLLYDVSDNAFGNGYANIFRIFTIVLAIGLTIVYKKKKGIPLEVNKRTVWLKVEK